MFACKDCKYHHIAKRVAVCEWPGEEFDFVTGDRLVDTQTCRYRREGSCGHAARFWEPTRYHRFKMWLYRTPVRLPF